VSSFALMLAIMLVLFPFIFQTSSTDFYLLLSLLFNSVFMWDFSSSDTFSLFLLWLFIYLPLHDLSPLPQYCSVTASIHVILILYYLLLFLCFLFLTLNFTCSLLCC
jgi:hypothetical protein